MPSTAYAETPFFKKLKNTSQKSTLSYGTVILLKYAFFMETSVWIRPPVCNKATPRPSPLRPCHQLSNIQDQSWPKYLVPFMMDVLVETHRLCSPTPPWLEKVYPRLAWRLITQKMWATPYQSHRHQQAPNKQALSRPIPISLYTWPHSLAVTWVSPALESAPLHLKAKTKVLDSITENLELIELHQAVFILKNCFSIPKLTYLLHSAPCFKCKEELEAFDTAIRIKTKKICDVTFGKDSWSQAFLLIWHGGLGLRSAPDLSLPCFLLSSFACQGLVNRLLPSLTLRQGEVINTTDAWSALMIHSHDKRKHNQLGMTSLAKMHSLRCLTPQALGTTAGCPLHRKATPLPGQKPSQ